jgi:group I intron endonuclease
MDVSRVISGVYAITFQGSHSRYIGSSQDVTRRFREHLASLASKKHHNYKLQKAWRQYGTDKIKFHILLECSHSNLKEMEQKEINRCKKFRVKLFNILLKTEGVGALPSKMKKRFPKKKSNSKPKKP